MFSEIAVNNMNLICKNKTNKQKQGSTAHYKLTLCNSRSIRQLLVILIMQCPRELQTHCILAPSSGRAVHFNTIVYQCREQEILHSK